MTTVVCGACRSGNADGRGEVGGKKKLMTGSKQKVKGGGGTHSWGLGQEGRTPRKTSWAWRGGRKRLVRGRIGRKRRAFKWRKEWEWKRKGIQLAWSYPKLGSDPDCGDSNCRAMEYEWGGGPKNTPAEFKTVEPKRRRGRISGRDGVTIGTSPREEVDMNLTVLNGGGEGEERLIPSTVGKVGPWSPRIRVR